MQKIEEGNAHNLESGPAILSLGFRPFFLAAGIFSVVSMLWWLGIYQFQLPVEITSINLFQWHAHEMIYGYALAVITGFLLTATKNWTGIQTLHGKPLLLLLSLWAVARLLFLFGSVYIWLAGVFDILFLLFSVAAVAYPIVKVKQWRQMAVLSKLILLLVGNVLFYLGALGLYADGVFLAIYGGLYLIVGLILTIGRRVLPMFIQNGVDSPVTLFNSKWLDLSSLAFFLLFFISELFFSNSMYTACFALAVFFINAIRLIGWHCAGIWKKSLLWSLYLSFWFICLGFLLFAGVHFFGISKYLAIHALAFGGIGVVTLAMMSRVALGHTGRDLSQPPKALAYAFAILILGGVLRVFVPLLDVISYSLLMGITQGLWILSFSIFVVIYYPILTRARADGAPG